MGAFYGKHWVKTTYAERVAEAKRLGIDLKTKSHIIQDPGEWRRLDDLLDRRRRRRPARVMAEIGVWHGGTTYMLARHIYPGGLIVGIDAEVMHGGAQAKKVFDQLVAEGFQTEYLNMFSNEAVDEAAKVCVGGIDILHIDGDHELEGVTADFENYSPLVNKGGHVIFHDIGGWPGVIEFWNNYPFPGRKWAFQTAPHDLGIGVVEL